LEFCVFRVWQNSYKPCVEQFHTSLCEFYTNLYEMIPTIICISHIGLGEVFTQISCVSILFEVSLFAHRICVNNHTRILRVYGIKSIKKLSKLNLIVILIWVIILSFGFGFWFSLLWSVSVQIERQKFLLFIFFKICWKSCASITAFHAFNYCL
jgi:hypothetical protein